MGSGGTPLLALLPINTYHMIHSVIQSMMHAMYRTLRYMYDPIYV